MVAEIIKNNNNFIQGICGEDYYFDAKVLSENSEYGINSGKVIKISVYHKDELIINYDRGWDLSVMQEDEMAYNLIIDLLENNL